jgi:hypothetical protein
VTLPWFATATATVKHYPTATDHGSHVIDYTATPTRTDITGCSWQPSDGQELDDRREATMRTGRLYMPAGTVIDGAAIVEIGGRDYQVVGDPADWSGMPLWGHVVAVLHRWEG